MKTLLVLCLLLCAACAAPAEDKKQPAELQVDTETMMTREEAGLVPEDPVPVQDDAAAVQEEAEDPEARFNLCPAGWYSHGSRCFLFSSSSMTWYSAEEYCNSLGAQLASATNPQEYAFMQQITRTASQSTAWLGGFYLQGRWLWIDRQGYYYSNFYYQSTPVSSYPCIHLRSNLGWGNQQCGTSRPFICSKNMFGC